MKNSNNLTSKDLDQSNQNPRDPALHEKSDEWWEAHDSEYIHYVYKITNKVNKMFYYGIHSTLKSLNKEPMNDGYWGSGAGIREAIKLEGIENFTKEIVEIFKTRQEVRKKEAEIVTIDLVKNPNCYNRIVGGGDCPLGKVYVILKDDPNSKVISVDKEEYYNNREIYKTTTAGRVPVYLIESGIVTSKVICVSKEEYYKNRDLYIPTGHIKYYSGKKESRKKSSTKTKKNWSRKTDESDTLYCRRREFINKTTLEIKAFIGHDEPDKLLDEWFPIYFYNKSEKCFISKDYFEKEYKNLPNIAKLAIKFRISTKHVRELRDYYISCGSVLDESNKLRNNTDRGSGFTNKTFVNKDGNYTVIDKNELDDYLSLGYEPGKTSSKITSTEVINYYSLGNSLEKTAKYFKTTKNIIKYKIGIDDSFNLVWFHNDKRKECIHLLVNDSIKDKVLENEWSIGKKNY